MVILLVPAVFAAALAVAAVIDWRRLRRSGYQPFRTAPLLGGHHEFAPGGSATFLGGGAHPPVKLSGPTVRLTVDATWAHLHGTGGMLDVWIPRDRITGVKTTKLTTTTAVRFLAAAGDLDGVLFHTRRSGRLLTTLGSYGWPIP